MNVNFFCVFTNKTDRTAVIEVFEQTDAITLPRRATRGKERQNFISDKEDRNMKKLLAGLFLAATLCIGLAACAPEDGKSGGTTAELLRTKEGFYAYSAASIGSIIDAADAQEAPAAQDVSANGSAPAGSETDAPSGNASEDASGATETADDGQLATVNKYIALADSLLGESGISSQTLPSDRTEYAVKHVVSYTDMAGESVSYTVYYNEELIAAEYDRDESEEVFRLAGVLLVDGTEYPVSGMKSAESESERGEEETENETWFRADLGEGNFIRIGQETENEQGESEQELVCTVRMNGITEETTLELEEERGEREVKMTVRKDGRTDVFEFEEESRGNTRIIEVTARSDGKTVSFTAYVTVDENGEEVCRYEFSDGRYKDFHRFDD